MVTRNGTPDPDAIVGTVNNDTLRGLSGNDILWGFDGHDQLLGGNGDDQIWQGTGQNTVYGGAGDDEIHSDGGLDTVYGGLGDDDIVLNEINYGGLTTAFGDDGNDHFALFDKTGATVDGGTGIDMIELYSQGTTDLFVDLTQGIVNKPGAFDNGVSLTSIERLGVLSYRGNDTVIGGEYDDGLNVGSGANEVLAGAGNDHVYYVSGVANTLSGGAGDDTLTVRADETVMYFVYDGFDGSVDDGALSLITGFETYEGIGSIHNDFASFAAGNDTFRGGNGQDTAFGMGGDDNLSGERGNDSLDGGDGDDQLNGGGGNDQIIGGDGNDRIGGNKGDDLIDGGAGNDRILIQYGLDTITGGAGRDTFLFTRNQIDFHYITDFTSGEDRLVFEDIYLPSAPPEGTLDPARLAFETATGSAAQFVLRYDAGADVSSLLWDDNGADRAGGAYIISFLRGQITLVASDILII